MLDEQRQQVAHERPAAAHDHLDQQRLALLDRHAAVASDGLIAPLARQAEVVHRMPGLVQRTEHAGEQILGVVARGDADIARHAFGERMLAVVDAPAVERKAEGLHQLDDQLALLRDREAAGDRQRGSFLLQRHRLADQCRQAARQRLEHRIDVGHRDTGAELVDQRVVWREIQRLAQQLRLVAHQMQHFLEVRREQREVVAAPRGDPFHLGRRGRAREARDERHRRRDRMIALAAHFTQVRELPVAAALGIGLGPVEQPADPGRGQQRVVLGLERRELLAADLRAALRHHHRRVPAQQRERPAERVEALPFLLELLIGRCGHWAHRAGDGPIVPARAPGGRTPPDLVLYFQWVRLSRRG